MTPFKTTLTMCLAAFGSAALAQDVDCASDDYLEAAMSHLESHYRSFP